MQTQNVTSFPIGLMGSSYWQGLLDWLGSAALAQGTINERDLALISLTDDIDEAVATIVEARVARTEETGR